MVNTYLGNPDERAQVYPDYVRVCNSFNVPCERVMCRRDLKAALQRMLDAKTPYVLDVITPYTEHVMPFIPAGRTVADMLRETSLRLAQVPGVIGIKEATGNIERAAWLIKHAPKGFSVYSGDDGTAIALMLLGGQGNVSVTANIAPRAMAELCRAAVAGDAKTAREIPLQAGRAEQAAGKW